MAVSPIASASGIQMDYMKLLVAQLQNQNPLEPLNNNELASQLAQFSQLQQLESINLNFAKVLTSTERAYAASLLGKEVSFLTETETGSLETQDGTVEQVYHNHNGEILLIVDQGSNKAASREHTIRLEDVQAVKK